LSASPFLTVEDAAAFLRCSPRSVHERTRTNAIPCRRVAGTRRILFLAEELQAWLDGAALEIVVDEPDGAKVIRPVPEGTSL